MSDVQNNHFDNKNGASQCIPSLDHDHLLPFGSSFDPGVRIYSMKFSLLWIPFLKFAFLVAAIRLNVAGAAAVADRRDLIVIVTYNGLDVLHATGKNSWRSCGRQSTYINTQSCVSTKRHDEHVHPTRLSSSH
jgi:hypothetical protein